MPVKEYRLRLCQSGIIKIHMPPPHLDHAYPGIGEKIHGVPEKFTRGDEVRVEYRKELTLGLFESFPQRARLVALPVLPVYIYDIDPGLSEAVYAPARDLDCLISRVIEHLYLEQLPRVVDFADRGNEPLDHIHLVIYRELYRNGREVLVPGDGDGFFMFILLV